VTVVGPGGEKLFDEEGDYADMGGLSGELDVEAYTHYVLLPSGKIESGWEYKEDAIDRKQELKEDARLRSTVLGRRAVTSRGADPSQDESWHKGPLKRYSNA
jgi:hypothetical protein